jgi:hypothetical protein
LKKAWTKDCFFRGYNLELCKSRRETREEINIEGFDFSGNRSMSRILFSEIPTHPP